jgi:molybdopterin-guanine dinucleotide biosynthesis protein A
MSEHREHREHWIGAVLTGGSSRRMGTDKALLEVDGVAMAVRVARALDAAGATEVMCIGGDAPALAALGLTVVTDRHPGDGPLGAVITALAASPHPVVVLSPCDLLAPDPAAARSVLASLLAAPGVDVAVPVIDGVRQPLDGAYRVAACLPLLVQEFARGERSVKRAVEILRLVEVEAISPGALADADTPEELAGDR